MDKQQLLAMYRRMMDSIHTNHSIYYCKGRYEGYKLIAVMASNLRAGV